MQRLKTDTFETLTMPTEEKYTPISQNHQFSQRGSMQGDVNANRAHVWASACGRFQKRYEPALGRKHVVDPAYSGQAVEPDCNEKTAICIKIHALVQKRYQYRIKMPKARMRERRCRVQARVDSVHNPADSHLPNSSIKSDCCPPFDGFRQFLSLNSNVRCLARNADSFASRRERE
jgi:hypothetical protein